MILYYEWHLLYIINSLHFFFPTVYFTKKKKIHKCTKFAISFTKKKIIIKIRICHLLSRHIYHSIELECLDLFYTYRNTTSQGILNLQLQQNLKKKKN